MTSTMLRDELNVGRKKCIDACGLLLLCYRCSVVCVSVCLLVTIINCARLDWRTAAPVCVLIDLVVLMAVVQSI